MRLHQLTGLALGAMLLTPAAPAAAQQFSLSPQIGLYVPTDVMYDVGTTGDVYKLRAGPSFGARVGLLFANRIGLDVSGSYVPTTFRLRNGSTEISSEPARLFNGAGQIVVFLIPASSPLTVFVNGGVGVVSRGGVAFTSEAAKSNVSGVFGGGAAIRLGPIGLHVGADLFAYNATYQGAQASAQELRQLDVQLHMGLGVPFGK